MSQERLWSAENKQVIREIIPGGHEPRQFLLYPDVRSAQFVQRLEDSRFVPNFLVALMDDGMPLEADSIEQLLTDDEELRHAA